MQKYVCDVCGYIYDPEVGDPTNGVPAGTAWENVPEDWECSDCGVGKESFEPVE
ncbi:rubredoxin [Eubacterium aggregans]|uniref:rubredoxin n=1 Tax=Eubacterium aggregans TaxID=81409 RepID=UPI003F2E7B40